jgi:hypothetical protein
MVMYRRVVALIVVAACDAGAPPAPPVQRDLNPPAPPVHRDPDPPPNIEWSVGGLGVWRGQTVGGEMCHVQLDLAAHRVAIRDPDGTTYQPMSADRERQLLELAAVVRTETVVPPSNSCTDRLETVRVDGHVIEDSCPIKQPGAARLAAELSAFCKPAP